VGIDGSNPDPGPNLTNLSRNLADVATIRATAATSYNDVREFSRQRAHLSAQFAGVAIFEMTQLAQIQRFHGDHGVHDIHKRRAGTFRAPGNMLAKCE
jgi:hypothetical protein